MTGARDTTDPHKQRTAEAREQHADLRAAHSLVSRVADDSGSDSDLSEYEQEMRKRTATAFDVGTVDPAILDRGVWKGAEAHAQSSEMKTAGTSTLPVRQWSMTPDAASTIKHQATFNRQSDLQNHARASVTTKAKAVESHYRRGEDSTLRHLRKVK